MRRYGYLVALFVCYCGQLLLKFRDIDEPVLVANYLADLLCLPLMLSVVLLLIRLVQNARRVYLTWPMVLFAFCYVSIVFEFLLPRYYVRFTSDPFDVVMYALGGIGYYVFQRKLVPC